MKKIQLQNCNQEVMLDDEDYDKLYKYGWNANFTANGVIYAQATINNETVLMHRVIMNLSRSDSTVCDHRNDNGLDNQKTNLRLATYSQNNANRRISNRNKSGFKGVSWRKKEGFWSAEIHVRGKKHWLGFFRNKKKAALAYDEKAKELLGEFARLNFPGNWVDGTYWKMNLTIF